MAQMGFDDWMHPEMERASLQRDEGTRPVSALDRMVLLIISGQSKRDMEAAYDLRYPTIGSLPF